MDVLENGGTVVPFQSGGRQGGPRRGAVHECLPRQCTDEARLERQLQVSASQGDSAAWEELVAAHLAEVWALAVRLTDQPEEAALVCETVWLRLAQQLPVPGSESLTGWLGRAVYDEARRTARVQVVVDRRGAVDESVPGREAWVSRLHGRMV